MIDRCIASIVDALQKGGINMRGSCCGHGKKDGRISLQDGRELVIPMQFHGQVKVDDLVAEIIKR